MKGFDTVVMVDWSARAKPSPKKPAADAIWAAVAREEEPEVSYHRTRAAAMAWLRDLFEAELAAGRRVLAGFDFPFGYPKGFAQAVSGKPDPLALWQALQARIEDAEDNTNNRFQVARNLNALFPGIGPFWGCPPAEETPDLPAKGSARHGHGLPERRAVEERLKRAQPCWKLYTTGSVGSQVLLGLPHLQNLRERFGDRLAVSPFQATDTPIVLAEIYPSLLADEVRAHARRNEILDATQVRVMAQAFRTLPADELSQMLQEGDREEGWILGLGHEQRLILAARGALGLEPPQLKDDCFALPPGVDWTPVAEAMNNLRQRLRPVVRQEVLPIADLVGRVLAEDITAKQANPPEPNTAVDGYGFAHAATGEGPQVLPLVDGRAAAGLPYDGRVPEGSALRILTGAVLPPGVDTVVLEEDCSITKGAVAFQGPIKPGANTRQAGEDFNAGDVILRAGQVLRPPDIALLAASGHGAAKAYRPLKVAVLSTGDELLAPGDAPRKGGIYDANRPLLASLIEGWGHEVIDLGRAGDSAEAVREALERGAAEADAILTSGGASAGDEDHVSALLSREGQLSNWRIALKPGRPLVLAMWQGVPVFGLPGNPVAAMVCALIFARPSLSVMGGGAWLEPMRLTLPAAFRKSKKPGRSEYLRARINEAGAVEVFASEGSGRISGLSWATGLVEIGHDAVEITPGDPVTFLPYAGMGVA